MKIISSKKATRYKQLEFELNLLKGFHKEIVELYREELNVKCKQLIESRLSSLDSINYQDLPGVRAKASEDEIDSLFNECTKRIKKSIDKYRLV